MTDYTQSGGEGAPQLDIAEAVAQMQMRYEVVAALTIGEENLLYEKDYRDPAVMQAFLDWLAENPAPDLNLNLDGVSVDDRFLVLSTCVQEVGGDSRYIVVARLAETR